jgi:hypothetical protein
MNVICGFAKAPLNNVFSYAQTNDFALPNSKNMLVANFMMENGIWLVAALGCIHVAIE